MTASKDRVIISSEVLAVLRSRLLVPITFVQHRAVFILLIIDVTISSTTVAVFVVDLRAGLIGTSSLGI